VIPASLLDKCTHGSGSRGTLKQTTTAQASSKILEDLEICMTGQSFLVLERTPCHCHFPTNGFSSRLPQSRLTSQTPLEVWTLKGYITDPLLCRHSSHSVPASRLGHIDLLLHLAASVLSSIYIHGTTVAYAAAVGVRPEFSGYVRPYFFFGGHVLIERLYLFVLAASRARYTLIGEYVPYAFKSRPIVTISSCLYVPLEVRRPTGVS